jgi:hypothetical protein
MAFSQKTIDDGNRPRAMPWATMTRGLWPKIEMPKLFFLHSLALLIGLMFLKRRGGA